jgi:Fic family protein
MDTTTLTEKKQLLDSLKPLPLALVRSLNNWFTVELTYTSNAIEGNTLTQRETALIIEKGLTTGGKTLQEHIEAINHAKALESLGSFEKKPSELTVADIVSIHRILLKTINDATAGCYRVAPVHIAGSTVMMPNPHKIPDLMTEFVAWLTSTALTSYHPVTYASEAHYRFVSIHPFREGNGHTGRLLMNLLLMMHGYPPAILSKRDESATIASLEKAQLGEANNDYKQIIYTAVDRSLDIMLEAIKGKTEISTANKKTALKIGQLAYAVGVPVPTIRYWLKEGLIESTDVTASGYHLFTPEMIERCQRIQQLKSKRLTLNEIKKKLVY